ncbi:MULTISPECIES: ABC-three component system protein [unclassified Beijerinckia]|uniref:ABC-three component system protein n=1 Tax=unclassified Beijerinckia TaxID=2638183 RepID=UPI00089534D1|nr:MULTISPECIES: ABC-three component system protein [unclassified Beijerinckia]MDH7794609.1 hypothetical protein [Beijerinckia sp. GAS462]SEB68397.1 hypothetical protein SAMN05443249_0881 [Beijerinckia sp. 28-YEA-48]
MKKLQSDLVAATLEPIGAPSAWPGANARLLGLGVGLPVDPLVRLAQFSAADFERFTLEWVAGYLAKKVPEIVEVQQRGGAGDKGRDVIAWLDTNTASIRRWRLYQCKHYAAALGEGTAAAEIAKLLFYTKRGDYTIPEEYHFITHKGMTSNFQDLLDSPENLRKSILDNWDKYCREKIQKDPVELTVELKDHINKFPFSIFRAKQPQALLEEHQQTPYHLTVFGAPLIQRPKPPQPPSAVAPGENQYVAQLLTVVAKDLGQPVSGLADFLHSDKHRKLFDRSRLTFYCAEGLKELARDQMADKGYFDMLFDEFSDGLYHWYTGSPDGYDRLVSTIKAAQSLQLSAHALTPHVVPNDREGMCHQMANDGRVEWCEP